MVYVAVDATIREMFFTSFPDTQTGILTLAFENAR
jgi:hypothetical protein